MTRHSSQTKTELYAIVACFCTGLLLFDLYSHAWELVGTDMLAILGWAVAMSKEHDDATQ